MVKVKSDPELGLTSPYESGVVSSVVKPDGLAGVLVGVASKLMPGDYDESQVERAPLLYVQLRQKDLKDDAGRLARTAGGFRTGNVKDLTYDDATELLMTVVGFKPGRVYFENLTDTKPVCRSDDMEHGSHPRETVKGMPVYGDCKTCWFGQWGSAEGGRQRCRENRRILAVDWSNERPIVLTIGPSSLKNWIAYANSVQDEARKLKDKDGRVPFIHHLLRIKVVPEYRAEPAGHYVVTWVDRQALPEALQEQMVLSRAASMERFADAVRVQQYEAADFVGGGGDNAEVPF